MEMKKGLYINEWLGIESLNKKLNKPKYQEIEILYINTLEISYGDLKKINFPIFLKKIFINLYFTNYIFLDGEYTNTKLTEYFRTRFLDEWRIPFDCNLTFRISQSVWDMGEDTFDDNDHINMNPEKKYCEWIVSGNKIIYDSMTSFEAKGCYENTSNIMDDMFKKALQDIIWEDREYKINASSFVKPF